MRGLVARRHALAVVFPTRHEKRTFSSIRGIAFLLLFPPLRLAASSSFPPNITFLLSQLTILNISLFPAPVFFFFFPWHLASLKFPTRHVRRWGVFTHLTYARLRGSGGLGSARLGCTLRPWKYRKINAAVLRRLGALGSEAECTLPLQPRVFHVLEELASCALARHGA